MTTSPPPAPFFAVVDSVGPLRIRSDRPGAAPWNVTPADLVGGLAAGDNVLVQVVAGRPVVVGRVGGPVWRTYSPQLQATTTNPTGWTSSGRYLLDGPVCHVEMQVATSGTSWARGTGSYQITLPVAPAPDYSLDHRRILTGEMDDGTAPLPVIGRIENGDPVVNRLARLLSTGVYSTVNDSAPASGSWRINLAGTYRHAT